MGERLALHEGTPQQRFLDRAASTLVAGGVVVLPTDTCYALTALVGAKAAVERICRLKRVDAQRKLFSLVVPDLADVARYAAVDNQAYRLLRRLLPGPYTFVLPATRDVPRMLLVKRKTIGLRVPDHAVPREVARLAGGALLATTLRLPDRDLPLGDPEEIEAAVGAQVDLVVTQGPGGLEPSTLVDLTGGAPSVLRAGAGDPAIFG